VETIKGQRLAAAVVGLLFGLTAVTAIGQTVSGAVTGLKAANGNGNTYGLSELLFGKYVLAFEFTSALLITAALGAMVLAHRERLDVRLTQGQIAAQRMQEYAETGRHPGPLPTPGVYARHNAVDTPALLPDGTPSELSISSSIASRGQVRDEFADDVEEVVKQLEEGEGDSK
jgi:NADH-quinone oxidoreductase subunit J